MFSHGRVQYFNLTFLRERACSDAAFKNQRACRFHFFLRRNLAVAVSDDATIEVMLDERLPRDSEISLHCD
jgi:hypothetical protein